MAEISGSGYLLCPLKASCLLEVSPQSCQSLFVWVKTEAFSLDPGSIESVLGLLYLDGWLAVCMNGRVTYWLSRCLGSLADWLTG